jgi:hypothetical protein
MSNRFQRGDLLPCQWQPTGGILVSLGVSGKSADFMSLLFDVTNVLHGGTTARIAGKRDGSGNLNFHFDADAAPWQPVPHIVDGVTGVIVYGVSTIGAIQIPIIIEKIHFEDKVESDLLWNFDWKLNALAGFLVYPAVL